MERTESVRPIVRVALLSMLACLAGVACSDSSTGGNTGGSGGASGSSGSGGTGGSAGNGSGGDNPCLQSGNPGCSTVELDEFGLGGIEISFSEQRAEAVSGPAAFPSARKGGGSDARIDVSAFEQTVSCSTTQPGDAFHNVECASYAIESYIDAVVGEWFKLELSAGGGSAPLTLRVVESAGTYRLEVAWGSYECTYGGNGNGEQVCFGETVGDGSRDSCCRENSDCGSNRCCTSDDVCDFSELDNRYTCRDAI